MAQTAQFSCFLRLPYDIRHQIYVLATPPRLVRLVEIFAVGDDYFDQDFEGDEWIDRPKFAFREFEQQLHDGSLAFKLKLHPEIAKFAHIWRHQIPWPRRWLKQTKLDAYGFTSSRAAYQPWEPTPETPEIPIDWLTGFPELAFELTRNTYFSSDAPIPPFLHVSTESREALTSWGYQLAFSTRHHGPKTWFHFGRDRLYIPKTERDISLRGEGLWPSNTHPGVEPGEILSGCPWDIGQLSIQDLSRVKRLVLGRSFLKNEAAANVTKDILQVCPSLEELSFENWSALDIILWYLRDDNFKGRPLTASENTQSCTELEAEPCDCIAMEDTDFVGNVTWSGLWEEECLPPLDPTASEPDTLFWNEKKRLGLASYTEFVSKELEKKVARQLGTSVQSLARRRVPTIKQVHLCPQSLTSNFMKGRQSFWRYYNRVSQDYAEGVDVLNSTIDVPNPEIPFSFVWERIQRWGEQRMWEYEAEVRMAGGVVDQQERIHRSYKWYLDGIKIAEPSMDLI